MFDSTMNANVNIRVVRLTILRRLLLMACSIRLLLLVFMAATDDLIPDHNPGNDVSIFDMRATSKCYCLQGLACDPDWNRYTGSRLNRDCVDLGPSQQRFLSKSFLQPMTKWDGARFLTLALDLQRREPDGGNDPFLESEQAHAFLPLFPLLIRQGAFFLMQVLPKSFLPPTFEGVLVLSVLWINIITFSIALICLVDLTLQLTPPNSDAVYVAGMVATLFCLNPASIFFASAYSESLFAMCTFAGYTLYTRGHSYLAVIPWMAASYTRSNGCLIAAWLIIQGLAKTLQSQRSTLNRVGCFTWHVLLSIAVVLPTVIHDRTGYALHCHREVQPDWCLAGKGSFYGYVQRRHWNVGFLRYYQLKQIPNFLLAAPILIFSTWGVVTWIRTSWIGQKSGAKARLTRQGVFQWALWALRRSSDEIQVNPSESMLHCPQMLSHYAVLAAVALLGATVAHVQISTRLICSTCPAIYWHLAHLCQNKQKLFGLQTRVVICAYLGTYILVGTTLHVNFLPWT